MPKYPELSRLAKAPRFTSLNFRGQTPGSVSTLLSPFPSKSILDSTHPAITTPRNAFPGFRNHAFGMRAYPIALLDKPDIIWEEPYGYRVDTWEDRVTRGKDGGKEGESLIAPMILNNERAHRLSVSLLTSASMKQTSKKRSIRVTISRRTKNALGLIVSRGVTVKEVKGRKTLVLNEEEAKQMGDKWFLPGWTYVFYPTLELYRMPYHDLIPLLRSGLRTIFDKGAKMERAWAVQYTSSATVPTNVRPTRLSPRKNESYQIDIFNSPSLHREGSHTIGPREGLALSRMARGPPVPPRPDFSTASPTNNPERQATHIRHISKKSAPRKSFGLRGPDMNPQQESPSPKLELNTRVRLVSAECGERDAIMPQIVPPSLSRGPNEQPQGVDDRWPVSRIPEEDQRWKDIYLALENDTVLDDEPAPSVPPPKYTPKLFFPPSFSTKTLVRDNYQSPSYNRTASGRQSKESEPLTYPVGKALPNARGSFGLQGTTTRPRPNLQAERRPAAPRSYGLRDPTRPKP